MEAAREQRLVQLNELEELRHSAYENAKLYEGRVEHYHDKGIIRQDFHPGMKVLLFNSRLCFFPGKLRSRWDGPYEVITVFPSGAVEIFQEKTRNAMIVNGQRLKPYLNTFVDNLDVDNMKLHDPS